MIKVFINKDSDKLEITHGKVLIANISIQRPTEMERVILYLLRAIDDESPLKNLVVEVQSEGSTRTVEEW